MAAKMVFQPKIFIFSAPSGAGKTTLVQHLLHIFPNIGFSISACTRPARPDEIDGVDYYFLNPETFKQHIAAGDFVEWEEVYENRLYGTLKSEVNRLATLQKHLIFDVDVKGGLTLKQYFGDQALAVFVKPPSFDALAQRLKARQTENEESLQKRLDKAREELLFEPQFEKVLVNEYLEQAKADAEQLVKVFLQQGK